jgi:hypothetical protein
MNMHGGMHGAVFFRLDGVMLMAWVVVIIAKEKREKIH